MKKVFLIFLSLIFIFTFQVKAITLEDITSGKFQSKDIAEVYPSADGVHYFTATNGNTRIVKCEYRTGHEVDTLFDVKTARECNLEQFDGFSLSPDEKHLLIYADSEPIYRRSFKATYYTFEIRRNLLKPLSDGGKQQAAVYSPNGRMVAFVRDNNIFIKKTRLRYRSSRHPRRRAKQNHQWDSRLGLRRRIRSYFYPAMVAGRCYISFCEIR